MKTAGPWLFLSIYLLVAAFVGCVVVSAGVGAYCAIGLGCSGHTIISLYAETIIEAWPFMLLLLMPVVMVGGYMYTVRAEEKDEK
jgi:hypothetical protein